MSCALRDLQASSSMHHACSPGGGVPAAAASIPTTPTHETIMTSTAMAETAKTTAAKPGAYYRTIRLDTLEIARRAVAGRCTYCSEQGHARDACATGRLMRRVSRATLDARLRVGVCPLCGDPAADGHSKTTCPRKQALQATLSRGGGGGSSSKNNNNNNKDANTSPPRNAKGRVREGQTGQSLHKPPRHRSGQMCSSKWRVSSPPHADYNTTIMDFGDTASHVRPASPTSSTSSTSSTSTTTTLRAPSTPPPPTASLAALCALDHHPQFDWKQTQNLLDADATETVWPDIDILPVTKSSHDAAADSSLHPSTSTSPLASETYADLVEDLIELCLP